MNNIRKKLRIIGERLQEFQDERPPGDGIVQEGIDEITNVLVMLDTYLIDTKKDDHDNARRLKSLVDLRNTVSTECDSLETWCAAMTLEHNFPGDALDHRELGGVIKSIQLLRQAIVK